MTTSFIAAVPAPTLDAAREALRRHFGYPDFRPAQRRVVASVLAGRDTLAILPTGGGKSLCFQVPALVRPGLTLVISPLIALMQDQVAALERRGIPAAALNSALDPVRQDAILDDVADGRLRLLYTSPERLERLARDLERRNIRPALLAVDEAHCIAEWGHDFRPSFRRLARLRWRLGRPPVVALTGSATPAVRDDIARALKLGAWGPSRRFDLHLGSFDRPNLWFGTVAVRDRRHRWDTLVELLRREDRLALVYAPTRNATEGLSRALARAGFRAAPYHAGLSRPERTATLERFLGDELQVVVATSAFGMGIDKPDVRLVVHWTMPPTLESYYQEAGRAGRDGEPSRCVLLVGERDADLHRLQLDVTFPTPALVERIWREGPPPGTAANVVASAERLRRELHPERGAPDWRDVRERHRRALERIAAMDRYARGRGCRRAALVAYFGERLAACAGCDRCRDTRSAAALDPAARARLGELSRAARHLTGRSATALLSPATLARLAADPPATVAALAEVPGVGAWVAERHGGVLLGALGADGTAASAPPDSSPVGQAILAWRGEVAASAGIPEYVVLPDAVLRRIAEALPVTRGELARLPGVGPKTLLKHGDTLLDIIAQHR
jgi:ATP-dependent DNA helicase RecQ